MAAQPIAGHNLQFVAWIAPRVLSVLSMMETQPDIYRQNSEAAFHDSDHAPLDSATASAAALMPALPRQAGGYCPASAQSVALLAPLAPARLPAPPPWLAWCPPSPPPAASPQVRLGSHLSLPPKHGQGGSWSGAAGMRAAGRSLLSRYAGADRAPQLPGRVRRRRLLAAVPLHLPYVLAAQGWPRPAPAGCREAAAHLRRRRPSARRCLPAQRQS